MFDLEAASVANLAVRGCERAETAITAESEFLFQKSASGVEGACSIVGDGDLFPGFDVTDCVDGLALCIAVPIIVSIWKTAVIDEANGGVDSTNRRVGAAGQCVCFDNTAEWVHAREVVVKGEELSLFGFC